MADRPIIFSAPMIRALLEGRKTQTRRLARQPWLSVQPLDRLWVRETHFIVPEEEYYERPRYAVFRQDDPNWTAIGVADLLREFGPWRPSIHMPRWASRLTLTVEAVRVQRLQEISDQDAEAEGVVWESADPPFFYVPGIWPHSLTAVETRDGAAACFAKLWGHIHGPDAWDANPEVVALTFSVMRRNIDAAAEQAVGGLG